MKRHGIGFTKDPITGNIRRPLLKIEVTMKRFDIISKKVDDAIENGSFSVYNTHYYMPGLARWSMKRERGLCRR